MLRYYYKKNNSYLSLKSPVYSPDYIQITEQEFNQAVTHRELTQRQIELREKKKTIANKKALLNKYREDVEQVELFGMKRSDYEEKKALCRQLVEELRALEK